VENRHGLIVNTEVFEANGNSRTRCRAGGAGTDSGHETGNGARYLRKVRHRGIFKVGWVFTFVAAAYNLVRMRNLAIQAM
jgi:hypothetical protein